MEAGFVNSRANTRGAKTKPFFTHWRGRTSWISPTIMPPDEDELIAPSHPALRASMRTLPDSGNPSGPTASCRRSMIDVAFGA